MLFRQLLGMLFQGFELTSVSLGINGVMRGYQLWVLTFNIIQNFLLKAAPPDSDFKATPGHSDT